MENEIKKVPIYKQKKFVIPATLLLCATLVFAAVAIATHEVTVNVNEVLSSSQNGIPFTITAEPNADTIYQYNVTNLASVEEYTIVHITEKGTSGSNYTVSGNETKITVPAKTTDYPINITIHVAADDSPGTFILIASNDRVA